MLNSAREQDWEVKRRRARKRGHDVEASLLGDMGDLRVINLREIGGNASKVYCVQRVLNVLDYFIRELAHHFYSPFKMVDRLF